MEGVEIIADNQLARDSYLTAYSDEDGYYRIDLPEMNTTYSNIARMGTIVLPSIA